MGAAWGKPVPIDVILWRLVERTGWTWDYINSLPLAMLHDWLSIQDGNAKAGDTLRRRNAGK